MFKMLGLLIVSESTKKLYTFPLKDTSFKSLRKNSLDMLLRQNWDKKILFLLLAFNL